MTVLLDAFARIAVQLLVVGVALAAATTAAVVIQRIGLLLHERRLGLVARVYGPIVRRALEGDPDAPRELVASPRRYRVEIARLLAQPLIDYRQAEHAAAARAILEAMSLVPVADRYLRSYWWPRRTLAIRVFGLMQYKERTAQVVGALDDPNPNVRNAALDALADIRNPAALPAVVVRLHDASLQRGRRAAALAAFGSACEEFLLDLAFVDPEHRLNYARALAICGTGRSRQTLCDWTGDQRSEVKAASFEGLARVGLNDRAASLAIEALEDREVAVRTMAAGALDGWPGGGAANLSRHLDDAWPVAVRAAHSLKSMGSAGRRELEAWAARQDLPGELARQMLWETESAR